MHSHNYAAKYSEAEMAGGGRTGGNVCRMTVGGGLTIISRVYGANRGYEESRSDLYASHAFDNQL